MIHESREEKNKLLSCLRKWWSRLIPKIKKVIKFYIKQDNINLDGMYRLFNWLYEELYHDLILKKIKIEKKVLRIIEELASPINQKSKHQQDMFFRKVFAMK